MTPPGSHHRDPAASHAWLGHGPLNGTQMALLLLLLSLWCCGLAAGLTGPFLQGTLIGVPIHKDPGGLRFWFTHGAKFLEAQEDVAWHLESELWIGHRADLMWMLSNRKKALGHFLAESRLRNHGDKDWL